MRRDYHVDVRAHMCNAQAITRNVFYDAHIAHLYNICAMRADVRQNKRDTNNDKTRDTRCASFTPGRTSQLPCDVAVAVRGFAHNTDEH